MNFKGIPYKTEWVEFPDIEAVVKKQGGAPTGKKPDGSPFYTLPMIFDPSTKTVVTESSNIAKYLDKTYSNTPQLFPAGTTALQTVFLDTVVPGILGPLARLIIVRLTERLSPRGGTYIRTTREAAALLGTGESRVRQRLKEKTLYAVKGPN